MTDRTLRWDNERVTTALETAERERLIPQLSRSGSLAEQVRDSIFAAIISGDLEEGTRLRELPLSEHFGLSKTPVREALRLLEAEGLVEVNPRRGAVVTTLDEQAVRNLYELRLVLEIASVRRATESGMAPTAAEAVKAEMAKYLEEQPQRTFHRLDVRLHRLIAEMSGNTELADALERAHQRIQAVRVRVSVPARLRTAQRQHATILRAIRTGDPDAAEAAITRHVESARDHVLESLQRPVS